MPPYEPCPRCGFSVTATAEAETVGSDPRLEGRLGDSHYVKTRDGALIHCLVSGDGPTILFVPGFLMPAEVWEKQILHFQGSHRVIAMDPRSQGRSSRVSFGHHPMSRGQDIGDVLSAFGAEDAVLVAWSLGVRETVAYLHHRRTNGIPHHVSKLVLVDGHLGADLHADSMGLWVAWFAAIQLDRGAAAEASVTSMFKKPPAPEFIAHLIRSTLSTPEDTAVSLAFGAVAYDMRDALASVDAPILALLTPSSPLGSQLSVRGDKRPEHRVVSFDAGHALFYDEPERFNAELEAFL